MRFHPSRFRRVIHPLIFLLFALEIEAEEPKSCPPDRVVAVDLAAWAARARSLKSPQQLDAELSKIGIGPVSTQDGDPLCESSALRNLKVDLFSVELTPGVKSRVVQILAIHCPDSSDDAWQTQRGAVFVPIAKERYCRVETPFLNRSGSGWGPQLCNPALFAFENLTSASRKVIKLTESEEWCGSAGSDRGATTTVTWWELQGWQLERLLSAKTLEFHYHSPTPPVETLTTSIQVIGKGFPKQIRLIEKVTCDNPCEDEDEWCKNAVAGCKSGASIRLCSYVGRTYECKRESR